MDKVCVSKNNQENHWNSVQIHYISQDEPTITAISKNVAMKYLSTYGTVRL